MKKKTAITGAGTAVAVFQVTTLVYALYFLVVPGYYGIITSRNVLSFLADVSLAALPKIVTAGASFLYRTTLNEVIVFFALTAAALVWGILVARFMRTEGPKRKRMLMVLAGLILADLIIRFLPISLNRYPAIGYQAAGFVIRLLCLLMVLWDIRKQKGEA